MKVEFIKKGIVIFNCTDDTNWEEVKDKFEEMKKDNTVKSIEMTFKENTSLDDVNEVFLNQESKNVILQRVYLND